MIYFDAGNREFTGKIQRLIIKSQQKLLGLTGNLKRRNFWMTW